MRGLPKAHFLVPAFDFHKDFAYPDEFTTKYLTLCIT